MYWGFKKIPFTLYTCVLAKVLQNGAKFIQKLTPGFENHMRNLNNFRQAVENSKNWNWWATFVQKIHFSKIYIPSAKKFYTEDLSNITLTTCVKIHQITYAIFETISHFSRHNSSLFFLAQTLHNFNKNSPSKCKFLDFPLLGLKFTKFLISFFKQKVNFSSTFESFFSVMRDYSSLVF